MTNIIHWRKTNFFQVFFKIQVTIKKKQWFESSICFWIEKRVLNLDIVIHSHKRPQTEEKWVRKDRNKSCHHFSRTDLQTSECDVWSEVSNRTDRWVSTPDPDSQVKGHMLNKEYLGIWFLTLCFSKWEVWAEFSGLLIRMMKVQVPALPLLCLWKSPSTLSAPGVLDPDWPCSLTQTS